MTDQINADDYRCPCCMNYVYISFSCKNKHNICENCYMKVRKCPICRDDKITKTDTNKIDIKRKSCKNTDKGCNIDLFHFDDEHEIDCIYNTFCCKFCNMSIYDTNFDNIKNHYSNDCVNILNYIKYEKNNEEEITGRKYKITLEIKPSLINIENQYYIILIPKISQNKANFFVFSLNDKYKLSNYKIKLISGSNNSLCEKMIIYNKLICSDLELSLITINKSINLIIENMFIIDKKIVEKKINDVFYFESSYVTGEPGSPGNWTYDDLEEVTNLFMKTTTKK